MKHVMDDDYYKIVFCPFCGEALDEEENFDFEEGEEDE